MPITSGAPRSCSPTAGTRPPSEHLVCVESDGSRLWRLKGRLFAAAGEPRAAVACFMTALRRPGARPRHVLELGWALMQARDFEKAESLLVSFLEREPDDRFAQRLLAHLHRAVGRCQTALEVLRRYRPRAVVGKYRPFLPPPIELAWEPEELWREALLAIGRDPEEFGDPAALALDRDGRDELLCAFDEIARRPGGLKAVAFGLGRALESGEPWLIDWLRRCEPHLRVAMPRALPAFVARHGGPEDRSILVAGLAAGAEERTMSAAALVSFGFEEFQEVLDEMRSARQPTPAQPPEVWPHARGLLVP